jgi:hypothetical protein
VEIGEQALRLRHAVGRYDEKSSRESAGECGDERSVGRTWETSDLQLSRGSRQGIEHARKRGKAFERIEQTWK